MSKVNDQLRAMLQRGEEPLSNRSGNTPFQTILEARLNRRQVLRGGIGLAALGFFGGALSGCGGSDNDDDDVSVEPTLLGFSAVMVNRADDITVPTGYTAIPFAAWGTPITGSYPAYIDGGLNSGAEQAEQMGMNHDGMHFFPLPKGAASSDRGLLVMNHEYIQQDDMHPNGATEVDGVRTVPDEVVKEMNAHGVAVVEVQKSASGNWQILPSNLNRRITVFTPMRIAGPVAGSEFVITRYSPDGTMTRGTHNNCAHGVTPWGTYLTCEENWAGYFKTDAENPPRELARYGVGDSTRYGWETVAGDDYERFDVTPKGASASEDYRNEANGFGWIVEIDPYDPGSMPVKRTALGRFAHEGIVFQPAVAGQPVVAYSGCDARGEYIYKFVSRDAFQPGVTRGDILDNGTLYVARFDADGSGQWLALVAGVNGLTPENGFASQADILVNTRTAADAVGATPMDRPEWGAVNPTTGEVYFTLTNNTNRTADEVDAANPRAANATGHIIRWRERGNVAATSFDWDIFVLAGDAGDSAVLTDGGKALDDSNIFASPDGLWYDDNGILWIQTDMSGSQLGGGPFGNNQMLAAIPETGQIKRFLVGPVGCEVTGVITTPDRRTMFVNIQHPTGTWPDGGSARPRSATVIVTKDDGGIIGT